MDVSAIEMNCHYYYYLKILESIVLVLPSDSDWFSLSKWPQFQ